MRKAVDEVLEGDNLVELEGAVGLDRGEERDERRAHLLTAVVDRRCELCEELAERSVGEVVLEDSAEPVKDSGAHSRRGFVLGEVLDLREEARSCGGRNELPVERQRASDPEHSDLPDALVGVCEERAEAPALRLDGLFDLPLRARGVLHRERVEEEDSGVPAHKGVCHGEGPPEDRRVQPAQHLIDSLLWLVLVEVRKQARERVAECSALHVHSKAHQVLDAVVLKRHQHLRAPSTICRHPSHCCCRPCQPPRTEVDRSVLVCLPLPPAPQLALDGLVQLLQQRYMQCEEPRYEPQPLCKPHDARRDRSLHHQPP